jgi:hypothetical protein
MSEKDNAAQPYPPHPYPLLRASPDFWWMNEVDKSNAFEARARAYLGQGYRSHPGSEREQER